MALSVAFGPVGPPTPTHDASQPPAAGSPCDAPAPAAVPETSPAAAVPPERWFGAVTALGAFLRARRASVSIASVLSITVMIFLCGGLMAIAHEAYSQDRMDRAARAAARAIALLPPSTAADEAQVNAVVCDVLRIEFGLEPTNDCSKVGPIHVSTDLTAADLAGGEPPAEVPDSIGFSDPEGEAVEDEPPAPTHGDIILVQIGSGHAVIRREPAS